MKAEFKTILIVSAMILWFTSGKCQVSIAAGAGYKNSLAGHLAVSYQYKQIELSGTMLSLPFRKATYFTPSLGYLFQSNDWQVKPYAGASLKYVGNTHSQDRYMNQVLKSNQEVNEWLPAFGLMFIKGVGYVDFNYENGFSAAIGLRYTFN